MRIERLLSRLELDAPPGAVGQKFPALLIVLEIGDHDQVAQLGGKGGRAGGDEGVARGWRRGGGRARGGEGGGWGSERASRPGGGDCAASSRPRKCRLERADAAG